MPCCSSLGAVGEACAHHGFAQAAVLNEGFLQGAKLLVQEVVRHLDQTDDDIGRDLKGRKGLKAILAVARPCLSPFRPFASRLRG